MKEILQQVITVLDKHPDYRVVTDVGMSMCSGWGNLESFQVHHDLKTIELFFE